jgi:hypothetical protein
LVVVDQELMLTREETLVQIQHFPQSLLQVVAVVVVLEVQLQVITVGMVVLVAVLVVKIMRQLTQQERQEMETRLAHLPLKEIMAAQM